MAQTILIFMNDFDDVISGIVVYINVQPVYPAR